MEKKKITIPLMLAVFLLLNFLDYILTLIGVSKGVTEVNPLMSSILKSIPTYSIVKLALPTAVVLSAIYLIRSKSKEIDEKSKSYKACRIATTLVVVAYVFIVINNAVWVASAIVIDLGENITAQGISNSIYKYMPSDNRNQYLITVHNAETGKYEVWLLFIDMPSWATQKLIINLPERPLITISSDNHLFLGMSGGIYMRKDTSTSVLDWGSLSNSGNLGDYFYHITTDTQLALTADSNYVYYIFPPGEVKIIDSSMNVYSLGNLNRPTLGGASCGGSYCSYGCGDPRNLLVINGELFYFTCWGQCNTGWGYNKGVGVVLNRYDSVNGTFEYVGRYSIAFDTCGGLKTGNSGGGLFFTDKVLYAYSQWAIGQINKYFPHTDYIADFSNATALTYDPVNAKPCVQMVDKDLIIFIDSNGDIQTQASIGYGLIPFSPEPEPTPPPSGSHYITKLSRYSMLKGEKVKVYIYPKENPYTSVENALIYVDGYYTGVKTQFHCWWWFLPFFCGNPYAEIQINEEGIHYIQGKVGDELSQPAIIEVKSSGYTGGTNESGTYPTTPPEQTDEGTVTYMLYADKTTVFQYGEVTFKVYKLVNGESRGTVEADIYVNGELAGTTGNFLGLIGDKELRYKFQTTGKYEVYAEVEGRQTGTLIITVLETYSEKEPTDSGDITLTVQVVGKDNRPLSGIIVQRWEGNTLREQRITEDGEAVLTPVSGKTYTILATDPSNNYLPVSKTGSWTSDDVLVFNMTKAGDINDDNQPDIDIDAIQVRVDGYAEDGSQFYIGKHRITVVDDYGKELSGAEIYINGEKVGETSGSIWNLFGLFGAGLDYNFGAGNYIIEARYGGLMDIISITVVDEVDPTDPDAVVLISKMEGLGTSIIGNLTVKKNQQVCFIVTRQGSANSIFDWDRISGATIYINGEPVGTTAKTSFGGMGGIFSFILPDWFGAEVGYIHKFFVSGTYSVNATTQEGDKTQTIYVTVTDEEYSTSSPLGGFFENLATQMPIIGDKTIDSILWAVILIVGGLIGIMILLSIVRVIL